MFLPKTSFKHANLLAIKEFYFEANIQTSTQHLRNKNE